MSEQHDDHIWLVCGGEAWAIMAIQRHENRVVFYLWRGFAPDLEFSSVEFYDPDWTDYCEKAVAMLQSHAESIK
jgi:hypothetical protein